MKKIIAVLIAILTITLSSIAYAAVIPTEVVLNQNLTIKSTLEEFAKDHDGIVAAQASINIFRFEDMQNAQIDSTPEQ